MNARTHTPILLDEVCSFVPHGQVVYLDLTLGRAGHASKILQELEKGSVFVGVDRDQQAIEDSKRRLEVYEGIEKHYLHVRDSHCFDSIRRLGIEKADFILMDIGVSSPQFDDPERGFSYRNDGPLDMRMDQSQGKTAQEILATSSEAELQEIFRRYGQCPSSRLVAREIVRHRSTDGPLRTTLQFVDLLKEILPNWEKNRKGHPAKQYFLALRYAVNDEQTELEKTLRLALDFLSPGGRLVVISFNYSEDRIVKDLFREKTQRKAQDKYLPVVAQDEMPYVLLTKKPVVPRENERTDNPRSKSAILRAIERR